jgi:hypothetical protein
MNYDQKKGHESNWEFEPPESKGQMSSNWGVIYIVGKIFLRATRYCPHILKKNLI